MGIDTRKELVQDRNKWRNVVLATETFGSYKGHKKVKDN